MLIREEKARLADVWLGLDECVLARGEVSVQEGGYDCGEMNYSFWLGAKGTEQLRTCATWILPESRRGAGKEWEAWPT